MSKIATEIEVPIDFTDELGGKYAGTFVLRPSMSTRDEADVGRRRRAIMGGSVPVQNDADHIDFAMARYQAELTVRAISVPPFWQKAAGDDLRREVVLHCGVKMDEKLGEWQVELDKLAGRAHDSIVKNQEKV